MPSKVDTLVQDSLRVAVRPPQAYADGALQVIFTIIGGPVWIKGFFMHTALAQAAGTTMIITCNGVAFDSAAPTNMNTAAGSVWVYPMAAHVPITALATPMPTTLALAHNFGMLASAHAAAPTINATIAGGFGGFANPISFYCVYYAMSPSSRIV